MEIDDAALERIIYTVYRDAWDEGFDSADGDRYHAAWEAIEEEREDDARSTARGWVGKLHNRTVEDGIGNCGWLKCERIDCGLGVTRPGEADCYGYFPCAREEAS